MFIIKFRKIQNILYNISKIWFDILENLKIKKTYDSFINTITNLTLVGEYVDSNSFLKYELSTIFFNSLINNQMNNICLDIEETFEIFERFELYICPIEKIEENITCYETLKNTINNFAEMIQSTSIVIQEEGSVSIVN